LVRHFGTKAIVTAGLLTVAVGFVVLSRATVDSGYGLIALVLAIIGVGMGTAMAPATDSIMGSLPPEKAGVGSAVNDTTRELGGTLGVAVVGSVFASIYGSRLGDKLGGLPIPAVALKLAKGGIGAAFVVAGRAPTPQASAIITNAARDSFMSGFHAGALAAAAVAFVSALAAWFLLPARAEVESTVSETGEVVEGAREFAA